MGHTREDQGSFMSALAAQNSSLAESLPTIQELLSRQRDAETALHEERENTQRLQQALADYATDLTKAHLDLASEQTNRAQDAAWHTENLNVVDAQNQNRLAAPHAHHNTPQHTPSYPSTLQHTTTHPSTPQHQSLTPPAHTRSNGIVAGFEKELETGLSLLFLLVVPLYSTHPFLVRSAPADRYVACKQECSPPDVS
jgi:hypothetical protein